MSMQRIIPTKAETIRVSMASGLDSSVAVGAARCGNIVFVQLSYGINALPRTTSWTVLATGLPEPIIDSYCQFIDVSNSFVKISVRKGGQFLYRCGVNTGNLPGDDFCVTYIAAD